ncbi:MAG: TadE/TadG family type IV pilus assembly protein [Geminicoccaceae bacterium]
MVVLRTVNIFAKFRRAPEGATAGEFALVLPVFLLLLAAVLEFSMIVLTQSLLDGGVREASRFATTGNGGTATIAEVRDIVSENTYGLIETSKIEVETYVFDSFSNITQREPFEDADGNGAYDAGESFTDLNGNGSWDDTTGTPGLGTAEDIVLYDVRHDYEILIPLFEPFFPPDGKLLLNATIAIRNEPFPVPSP